MRNSKKTTLEVTLKFEVLGMSREEAEKYIADNILSGQIAIKTSKKLVMKDISGILSAS